jgi:hypothetical protein
MVVGIGSFGGELRYAALVLGGQGGVPARNSRPRSLRLVFAPRTLRADSARHRPDIGPPENARGRGILRKFSPLRAATLSAVKYKESTKKSYNEGAPLDSPRQDQHYTALSFSF